MTFTFSRKDNTTGVVRVIDFDHSEVHNGHLFKYINTFALNNNEILNILIQTVTLNNKRTHFDFIVRSEKTSQLYFYEDSNMQNIGVIASNPSLVNCNRNCPDDASTNIRLGAVQGTGSLGNILISVYLNNFAFNLEEEFILADATYYLLRIISKSPGNNINVRLKSYEIASLIENPCS